MVNAVALVTPPGRVCASADFQERTMDRLRGELAAARAARTRWWNMPLARLVFALSLIVLFVLSMPYLGGLGTNRHATTLLAQSVEAMNSVSSVHIVARMRTPPGDNFESIGAGYDFQPVEMWKEFGATPRWRVENPGRVVVMDGTSSILFLKPDQIVNGGRNPGFIEWLRPLLDPERVLAGELRAAQKGESRATLRPDGASVSLTTTRKAAGEYVNGWGYNDMVSQSDHTRVYRFDVTTGRLLGLQMILHDGGRDVVVFEITEIQYNAPIAAERFTLEIPENAIHAVPPEQMPVNRPLPLTARDAAVTFLEGMAHRDWDEVLMVYAATAVPEGLKLQGGGLRVISIGEPFQSGLYPGWYVPYDIVLADGTHKQFKLAVRNDNPPRRWLQDGGF